MTDLVTAKLIEHGLLGVIVLVQMTIIVRLFNLLRASWEVRIEEGVAAQQLQHATLSTVQGLTEVIRDLRVETRRR